MWVDELGPHIEVSHTHRLQLHVVPPVDTSDVRLHIMHHLVPVVSHFLRNVPSTFTLVLLDFSHLRCKMHQFLGNAPHIHAGTSNAPRRALRSRIYVVTESDLGSWTDSFTFFGTCESS